MNALSFDAMLDEVLSWWPAELIGRDDDYLDPNKSSTVANFYENVIEPISLKCGSRLLMQLDWILFAIVDELSRKINTVKPREIRRSLLKDRFHKLLREIAIPQLNGEREWDNSFDRAELTSYVHSKHFT